MPYKPMPWVHSQSFQPLVSMTRPSSSRSRNSPDVSSISTRLRISRWIWRSMSVASMPWTLLGTAGSGTSVEVEQRYERPFDRTPVGMRVHQILHEVPPAAHERMMRQFGALVRFAHIEHREQVQRRLVEEDR